MLIQFRVLAIYSLAQFYHKLCLQFILLYMTKLTNYIVSHVFSLPQGLAIFYFHVFKNKEVIKILISYDPNLVRLYHHVLIYNFV